jgi:uncharacterized protein (UPF0548 family)
MSVWRFGSGWSESALQEYLRAWSTHPVNFDESRGEMNEANGWTVDGAHSIIGQEPPGPPLPDGHFARARQALINYDFSDPEIVIGHFDPDAEFTGRTMLLEIQVWGLHFLSGVRVHSVRDETLENRTIFGFRYDTLEGHIERGFEWFLLTKDHANGAIDFKIEAHWQLGDFPNWWSKVGFKLIGEKNRERWRRRALERLTQLAQAPVPEATAPPGEIAHRGGDEPETNAPNQP